MDTIPGYTISNQIFCSTETLVFRAQKNDTMEKFILKTPASRHATSQQNARYRHEYEILKKLNSLGSKGVVKAAELKTHHNKPCLIMEDFEGRDLKYLKTSQNEKPWDMEIVLTLGIKITNSLGEIYKAKIIHRDIKPDNILYNPKTGILKLGDFSSAGTILRENPELSNSQIMAATMAYMSPEQTGRMNRMVDWRTDFYSLGVTLYELATGTLPFVYDDPMEMIHAHIARIPASPHKINTKIPIMLSRIILKLMDKNAEQRYQSAYGLRYDLKQCLVQLNNSYASELFELGIKDISDRLVIPGKLYGRDNEIKIVTTGFKKICSGSNRMLLVTGEAGSGKSSLINEVQKSMARERAYFISGKFDKLKRIPYGALIQAFGSLLRKILFEDDHHLSVWRKKLSNVLTPNGRIIIDIIPELELIINKQPPVPVLGPVENENRFIYVFENFINTFISKDHPLILFLDDLQWADPASLNLIKMVLSLTPRYLYIIGAFRDNEVVPGSPLRTTLQEIKNNGTEMETIVLSLLTKTHVNQLTAETLLCSVDKATPLSDLCFAKTRGNPFFLNQFMLSLFHKNFIFQKQGKWEWEYEKIQQSDITDNVADLMIHKIYGLSRNAQKILRYASCIGNQFDLHTLSIFHGKSHAETAVDLAELLEEELILPLDASYKYMSQVPISLESPESRTAFNKLNNCRYRFLHDGVQQAAYSLIEEKIKKKIHLKIGEQLLKNIDQQDMKDGIFDIADHLNLGCELITETHKKDRLAQLNLTAGEQAKKSAAFDRAWEYLTAGINILGENAWVTQYDLTRHLYEQAAETAFLCGRFQQMEDLIFNVMEHAKTILDTIPVYKIKIQALTAQHQLRAAAETGLSILRKLGVCFPEKPGKLQRLLGYLKTKIILMGKSHTDLINGRTMTDAYALATLDIMQTMGFSVYAAAPETAPLFIFKGVCLSVKYGNTSFSSIFYGYYGIILCGMIKNIRSGYEFGKTSLRLLNKFNAMEFEAKTEVVFNFFIRHWKEPLSASLHPLKNAYKKGFQTGDFEFAAAAASQYAYFSYFAGIKLPKVAKRASRYNKIIKKLKQKSWQLYNKRTWQTALNLMECSETPTLLTGDVFNEKKVLDHYIKENNRTGICSLYINKLILCYLFHEYNNAVENAARAERDLIALTSHAVIPVFNFYDSLAHLALFHKSSKQQQKKILQKVAQNQKKMKQWASHAPANYYHKWCLVEAVRSGILEKKSQALKLYKSAIDGAKKNNYIQEQALANELASVFYLKAGEHDKAQQYITEARDCYETWGAVAKVSQLNETYPELLSKNHLNAHFNGSEWNSIAEASCTQKSSTQKTSNEPDPFDDVHVKASPVLTSQRTDTSTFMEKSTLDLASAIKASQIISREIQIEKLIANLMEIIVKNAGAQQGFLILKSNASLTIEAQYHVDKQKSVVMQPVSVDAFSDISKDIVHYTARTKKSIVLDDALNKGKFTADSHVIKTRQKSILCAPLVHQGKLNGIIYLENNLVPGAFTKERLEILFLLCSQAAISLENAKLYKTLQNYNNVLEEKIEERTDDLKKSIETIKRTQDQLIQSEKLAALGRLVAGIAHEINTPVGIAVTTASLLKDKTDDFIDKLESKTLKRSHVNKYTETAENASTLILTNLSRAVKIIHGFKQVAVDQTSEERREFNLKSYIEDILASLAPKLKKLTPKITIHCPEDLILTSFPGAFSQIITNFVMNSLIHGFEAKNTGEITFDIHTDNDTIIFCYMDNGKGIEKENIEKIFTPFFTTRRSKGGSGLGMHIVHTLVTQTLGGTVSYTPGTEKGVKFTIELPFKDNLSMNT